MNVHYSYLFTKDEQGQKLNKKAYDIVNRVNYAIDEIYAKRGNPPTMFRLHYKRFFLMREWLLQQGTIMIGIDCPMYADRFMFKGVIITIAYKEWKENRKNRTRLFYESTQEVK